MTTLKLTQNSIETMQVQINVQAHGLHQLEYEFGVTTMVYDIGSYDPQTLKAL